MSLNGTSTIMIFEPLSAPERAGAIVVAVFSLLSILALSFIVLRTIRLATVVFLRPNDCTRPPEILFFNNQLGHYIGCLVLSNLFVSAAGLIDFSWVSHSGLSQGFTCSVQAVLRQIGIWGTCWFTATLGVHTLISFVFHIRPSRWRSLVAGIIGWSIALVAALAPLHRGDVYGPTGLSCGVTRYHPKDMFVFSLEALPVILAALVSITVYSVTFIVLRRKPSVNSIQNGGSSSNQQLEERFAEYRGFIRTIIWTMFWFPLAFVLLLLPFCVTHMVVFAGQSTPSASDIFADVCVSMLGFVNVCLLYHTSRVIGPVYNGRSAGLVTDTMKTFDNDASGEPPIVPPLFSRSPSIWSYEKNPQMYNPPQPSSNHWRDPSWASVNLNAGLLNKRKQTSESLQTKLPSQALSTITPPPKLISRQLAVDVPLRSTSPDPRISFATRDAWLEPLTQGQQYSSIANTDAPRKAGKGLIPKSKAPPTLDLPPLPPLSVRDVTNKSSTLAARLGIPAADAFLSSHASVIRSAQKPDQENERVPVFPVTELPRIEINSWSTEHANESNPQPFSPSSYTDGDSDYSGEIIHIRNVRSLPPVPELNDDEQDIDGRPLSSSMRARSERLTMTTVWSQETGYTLSEPDAVGLETRPQTVANLLYPGMLSDKANVVGRPTPSGPRARPARLSARVSEMLSPESPNSIGLKTVFNDNVV